jgi:hypothetical protein
MPHNDKSSHALPMPTVVDANDTNLPSHLHPLVLSHHPTKPSPLFPHHRASCPSHRVTHLVDDTSSHALLMPTVIDANDTDLPSHLPCPSTPPIKAVIFISTSLGISFFTSRHTSRPSSCLASSHMTTHRHMPYRCQQSSMNANDEPLVIISTVPPLHHVVALPAYCVAYPTPSLILFIYTYPLLLLSHVPCIALHRHLPQHLPMHHIVSHSITRRCKSMFNYNCLYFYHWHPLT